MFPLAAGESNKPAASQRGRQKTISTERNKLRGAKCSTHFASSEIAKIERESEAGNITANKKQEKKGNRKSFKEQHGGSKASKLYLKSNQPEQEHNRKN